MIRVTNWDELYETHESRKLKNLHWVPIKNHTDGFGHAKLILDHPNGSAHFAAWVGILMVASRCNPRGTLVSSGGVALAPSDIKRMTGLDLPFTEAIQRLIELGWLEYALGDSPATPGDFPDRTEQKGTEQNRTEQNYKTLLRI